MLFIIQNFGLQNLITLNKIREKLLYISVNSKPEDLSASKTVARKFINRFLEKNKNVVYEAGCINKLIINVEYKKGKNNFIDNIEDYIMLTLDDNKKICVDDARGLRIDRKYKTIESTGHFNILR